MAFKITVSKKAKKYLDGQTADNRRRILEGICGLPDGDVLKLHGRDEFRLHVGGYRVLFNRYDDRNLIDVTVIRPRGDVYKK